MRKSTIVKLKAEIERKRNHGFMDDVAEKTQRLKDLRRLWRKFGSDSVVLQMKEVVEKHVAHYEIDFYFHDLSMMESSGRMFLWYVYDSGTHFIWLEGTEEEVRQQMEWFDAIRQTKSNGIDVDHRHHMFIVDRSAGTLKAIQQYADVEFKVLESAAC